MPTKPPRISEAEWDVMRVVWDREACAVEIEEMGWAG